MANFSRREFLKQLGAAASILAFCPKVFGSDETFEMLAVGDSLMWGQGLEEKDKFYTLVKNWLQTVQNTPVNLKVKAHSAATLFLHEEDAKLLRKADVPETLTYPSEIGVPFPTLKAQIDIAKNEYENPEKVNLIMLTGGLVDISTRGILTPFGNSETLRSKIKKYCGDDMFRFLEHSADAFPNALLVVVGYFPIISKHTDTGRMFNAFLQAYSFMRPFKRFINNDLSKQFFKPIRRKVIRRSRIWFEESSRQLEAAVRRLNEKSGKQRAVFVKSPIGEANALETKETFLFRIDKKGRTDDALFDERAAKCREVHSELRKTIGLEDSIRRCEISAIGHPNVKGAKAYADAIIQKLSPILQR